MAVSILWPRRAWHAWAVWTTVLLLSTAWQSQCDHCQYHRRASAQLGCTVSAANVTSCLDVAPWCLHARTISTVSPHWFAKSAVTVGPSLVWAPLLVYVLLHKSESIRAHGVLVLWSAVAWLGLSMPLRFTTLFVGWDPSGHVLVIGLQLVPLWLLLQHRASRSTQAGSNSGAEGAMALAVSRDVSLGGATDAGTTPALAAAALAAAEVLGAVLALITASTAAFFHSSSEVLSAWAVATAVLAALTALRVDRVGLAVLRARVDAALVVSGGVCAVAGALALVLLRAMPAGVFAGYVIHDLATFAAARYLVLPACFGDAHGPVRKAAP